MVCTTYAQNQDVHCVHSHALCPSIGYIITRQGHTYFQKHAGHIVEQTAQQIYNNAIVLSDLQHNLDIRQLMVISGQDCSEHTF